MNFNWQQIYEIFEQNKSNKEFEEYFQEQEDNNGILCSNPFDCQSAQRQISKLISKYQQDLNWIANLYGNGRGVAPQPVPKTVQQVWDDLKYINDQIPLIALRRKEISETTKKLLGL